MFNWWWSQMSFAFFTPMLWVETTTRQALLQVDQQAPSWGVQARKASRCSEWWLQLRNGSLQVTHTHTYIYNSIIFRRLLKPTTLCKSSNCFLVASVTWPASKALKNESWDSVALKVSISSCFSGYSIRSGFFYASFLWSLILCDKTWCRPFWGRKRNYYGLSQTVIFQSTSSQKNWKHQGVPRTCSETHRGYLAARNLDTLWCISTYIYIYTSYC